MSRLGRRPLPAWLDQVVFKPCTLCDEVGAFECVSCVTNRLNILALKRTLAEPHMVWAAEQFSVGIDIVAEDKRLRARLKALADLEATMVVR